MKKVKKIDAKIKKEVIGMLGESEFSIAEIHKAYGICKSTLHKWRSQLKDKQFTQGAEQFVELSILEPKRRLTKASLIFNDITVSLEGKMIDLELISIAKLLGISC